MQIRRGRAARRADILGAVAPIDDALSLVTVAAPLYFSQAYTGATRIFSGANSKSSMSPVRG